MDCLILGAGRGGTSLLAGLLDTHPGIEVGFERHARNFLMGKRVPETGPDLLHVRVRGFLEACLRDSEKHPGKLWGNKITTDQLYRLEDHNRSNPEAPLNVLEEFFTHFLPPRRVIFVLRDGRTCVRSKVERAGRSLDVACEKWQYSVAVYRFLTTWRGHSVMVRYEDLVSNPESTLTRLCGFLGLEYSRDMLLGTENPKMAAEYRQPGFNKAILDVSALPDGILERLAADLEFCGYTNSAHRPANEAGC